jgi:competence protein ComEC
LKKKLLILLAVITVFSCFAAIAEEQFLVKNMKAPVVHYPAKNAKIYEHSMVSDVSLIEPNDDILQVDFINIGTGDAIFIRCNGETMLIDGGANSKANILKEFFSENGIENLNYFFCSHPHDDHLQAQIALIKNGYIPGEYFSPFSEEYKNEEHQNLVSAIKGTIPYTQISSGTVINIGEAKLTFFKDDRNKPKMYLNARSMMTNIRFGKCSVLLTGDVTGENIAHLCKKYPELVDVDILKSPHHGIDRLRGEVFSAIKPETVIITASKDAGARLAEQLRRKKITHYFTSLGTVHLESDGEQWYVKQHK